MPGNWNVSVGTVSGGRSFVATVSDAPCETVTVKFHLNGVLVAIQTVTISGAATFNCPSNTEGQEWTVEFVCPGVTPVTRNGYVQ